MGSEKWKFSNFYDFAFTLKTKNYKLKTVFLLLLLLITHHLLLYSDSISITRYWLIHNMYFLNVIRYTLYYIRFWLDTHDAILFWKYWYV